jgi:hypothetical protein
MNGEGGGRAEKIEGRGKIAALGRGKRKSEPYKRNDGRGKMEDGR